MRHRKAGRQFSRNTSHRRAMFRALAANLVAHERIETTDAKAKELRRVAERLITRAKRLGPTAYTPHDKLKPAERAKRVAAQKQVGRFLRRFAVVQKNGETQKIDLVEKVFVDLAQRYKDRPGGYTRILKLGPRRGDNAPMSIIELVDRAAEEKVENPKSKAGEASSGKPAVTAGVSDAKADAGEAEKKADEKPEKKAEAKKSEKKADDAAEKAEKKKAEAKKADDGEEKPVSEKKAPAKKKAAAKKADEGEGKKPAAEKKAPAKKKATKKSDD